MGLMLVAGRRAQTLSGPREAWQSIYECTSGARWLRRPRFTAASRQAIQQTDLAIEDRASRPTIDRPTPRPRDIERAADLARTTMRHVEEPSGIAATAAAAFGDVMRNATRGAFYLFRGIGAVLAQLRDDGTERRGEEATWRTNLRRCPGRRPGCRLACPLSLPLQRANPPRPVHQSRAAPAHRRARGTRVGSSISRGLVTQRTIVAHRSGGRRCLAPPWADSSRTAALPRSVTPRTDYRSHCSVSSCWSTVAATPWSSGSPRVVSLPLH